jgi:hypothetical protein
MLDVNHEPGTEDTVAEIGEQVGTAHKQPGRWAMFLKQTDGLIGCVRPYIFESR